MKFCNQDISTTITVSNSLKTPEDDSWSPNFASATKDQKIAANPMPQGLS